jgi:succinate dehydrogenase / fumarate reductase membrane anchor subunit
MSLGESTSAIGKVEGTGSARHGGEHWLNEKVLSAALVLLGCWFIASLVMLPALDQKTIVTWLRAPYGAVPMILFVYLSFRHALDGMKVVVDDYVVDGGNRFAINTILWFLAVGGGALALFALARIVFGAQG